MLTSRVLGRATLATLAPRLSTSPSARYASGYGDPDQTGYGQSSDGTRNRIDTEHPGPRPVEEGKGTGSGGAAETGAPAGSSSGSRSASGARPKISDQAEPGGKDDADVQRHNKEMSERYGQRKDGDQPVNKDYWRGHGGRDRQP